MDARNSADGLIYATEKSMREIGDKVDGATRGEVENVIHDLKSAMEGDDITEIKRLTELLTHASHRLAETMYQQSSPSGAHQDGGGPEGAWGPSAGPNDDVVDAEFRDVT